MRIPACGTWTSRPPPHQSNVSTLPHQSQSAKGDQAQPVKEGLGVAPEEEGDKDKGPTSKSSKRPREHKKRKHHKAKKEKKPKSKKPHGKMKKRDKKRLEKHD